MFGDSPWDYMSDDEKLTKQKQWKAEDKLRKAKLKKYRLQQLQTYSHAELNAELRRRFKEACKEVQNVL